MAAAIGSVVLLTAAAPLQGLAGHLPVSGGYAHRRWMNLFLGHSVHIVLERNWAWLAVFLTALTGYGVTLDRLRFPEAER